MATPIDYAGIQTKDLTKTPIIPTHQSIECRLYARRYPILALFVVYSAANALQWIQYSIVSDQVNKKLSRFALFLSFERLRMKL